MTVSKNVILDLLPLYYSDEASPDTRTLVAVSYTHLTLPTILLV